MYTCSKEYRDVPFAHRQPSHEGHCAKIHGHNWSFRFTFGAKELDSCGFVIDFGQLAWLKRYIDARFDHALVLEETDPQAEHLLSALADLAKMLFVPSASSEGIARYLFDEISRIVWIRTEGRVSLLWVDVTEDSKNGARFQGHDARGLK